MKNFERINITNEKLLKDEELITLRGGTDTLPCGEGYKNYWCDIWYEGGVHTTGWACCHILNEIMDVLDELYPGSSWVCEYKGGGGGEQ